MLLQTNSLFFYKTRYLHSSDFDNYSELQYTNAVNSFPTGFEDYTKNVFALFYFDKQESVSVNVYWMSNRPIEQILSEYDMSMFDFSEINCDDFLNSSKVYEKSILTMLH